MLIEIYSEALAVDEDLADQLWGLGIAGEIDDINAILAWLAVASVCVRP
jgi:hypothetical protein